MNKRKIQGHRVKGVMAQRAQYRPGGISLCTFVNYLCVLCGNVFPHQSQEILN